MATKIPSTSFQATISPSAAYWNNFKELKIGLRAEHSLNEAREHLRTEYSFVAT
jgi:hypothetical protein